VIEDRVADLELEALVGELRTSRSMTLVCRISLSVAASSGWNGTTR